MTEFDELTDPRRQPKVVNGPGHRMSGARHGRRSRDIGLRRLLAGVGVAAAVAVVSATSLTAYAAYDVGHGLERNAVDVGVDADSIDGAFNVLAVAGDNSPTQQQGGIYGVRGVTLNDSNVLLHVSADHTSATAISLPRDLIIDQPACRSGDTVNAAAPHTALNEAYSRGGLSCVVKTVEQVTGLTIPFAAQMSFDGIIGLSDAIGGVPVCVTSAVNDPYTHLRLKAGNHTVSGATALAFLRDRHGVGDGSDLSRISSLQQFLSSLVRKVKSNGTLSDPTKLYRLAKVASKTVVLSTSLAKPDTMVRMARTFQGIGTDKITFVQYPGVTNDPRFPGRVVPSAASAAALMNAVRTDRPFTLAGNAVGRGSTTAPGMSSSGAGTASGSSGSGSASRSTPPAPRSAAPSATPTTIKGVTGQTAKQKTCAVAAG